MEVEYEYSLPDIEQYTLEQLDGLIIEAQRILNARVEKAESLCRWLLLRILPPQGLIISGGR